jgi:glycosyltransferase involved in cell wall biosynthesis
MTPIRLAVIFDQQIKTGGGYQQALNAALLTRQLSPERVKPVYFTTLKGNIETLSSYGIEALYLRLSLVEKVWMHLRSLFQHPKLFNILQRIESLNAFEISLFQQKIDLVYFLSPSVLACYLERLNYITTVWDLCHRDDIEFPEVRWSRVFESREKNYCTILPRAAAIIVDSNSGKSNVVLRYGIDEERVHVIPFEAAQSVRISENDYESGYIDIRKKYHLDCPYVFYPAQFWAHKNHVYLLEGLKELEQRHGLKVGAIFSGSDQGNLNYIQQYVKKLSLRDRVRFAGFVPNEEMPYLYRQSLALVMPTYFGPTNLPPLEAFALGVPVLYPDKAGLREQVGNAALLLDLKKPMTMADHLRALITDKNLRDHLIKAGRQSSMIAQSQNDKVRVLESIVEEFRWRRICWK